MIEAWYIRILNLLLNNLFLSRVEIPKHGAHPFGTHNCPPYSFAVGMKIRFSLHSIQGFDF